MIRKSIGQQSIGVRNIGSKYIGINGTWSRRKQDVVKHIVRFVIDGDIVAEKQYREGVQIGNIDIKAPTGYVIVRWYDIDGNTITANTRIMTDMTLYAELMEVHGIGQMAVGATFIVG